MTAEGLSADKDGQAVREAVAAERRRIARELHDIVSHAVTGIVFQAAAAAQVVETDPAQIKQSLANIETAGRQVMADLQVLVEVLEAGHPAGHALSVGESKPQPGLADLKVLLTSLRSIGLPVTVHVEGAQRNLDPKLDLAAYRILQEGLTNVLKHAGKNSNPHLRLIWEDRSLLIQIDNDINPTQAHRGQALSVGRGLVGLHERIQAVGGQLNAGFRHQGGYRLTATLPLTSTEGSSAPCPPSPGSGDKGEMQL
jgi:signal transduction histidine kinase